MLISILASDAADNVNDWLSNLTVYISLITTVVAVLGVAAGYLRGFFKKRFFRIFSEEVYHYKNLKKTKNGTADYGYELYYRFKHYTPHTLSLKSDYGELNNVPYKKFCKMAKEHKIVILFGSSGVGKSLLMQKLAYSWRTKNQKNKSAKKLSSYNIIFFGKNKPSTVEEIAEQIAAQMSKDDGANYSVFVDGLDELPELKGTNGDALLQKFLTLINKTDNGKSILDRCSRIVISARPEIIIKSFSTYETLIGCDMQMWDVDCFTPEKTLCMYKNESRLHAESRSVRRQNIGKLKILSNGKNNAVNIFAYPFIITWLPEILKDIPADEFANYSMYDILRIIVNNDCAREYEIVAASSNAEWREKSDRVTFTNGFYSFITSVALYMNGNDKLSVTSEEVDDIASDRDFAFDTNAFLLSHRLLVRIEDYPVRYEFIHNLIYWYALSQAFCDVNFDETRREEIFKSNADTPILDFYHRSLWEKYNGCFSYYATISQGNATRARNEFLSAIKYKRVTANSTQDISHDDLLKMLFGFDCVTVDGVEYGLNRTVLLRYPLNKTDILEYTLPDSVTEIADGAFKQCTALKSLIIPDNVKKIGLGVFFGATIQNVTVGNGVFEFINSIRKEIINKKYLSIFEGSSSLINLTISGSVKKVEKFTFNFSHFLKSVKFCDGVTNIEGYAFWGCKNLTEVWISKSITGLDDGVLGVFAECPIEKYIVDPDNEKYTSIDGNLYSKDGKKLVRYACGKPDEVFSIPSGVEIIDTHAFHFCLLKKIRIPNETNLSIGLLFSGIFHECSKLTNIEVDESNERYKTIDGNLYSRDGKILLAYARGKTDDAFLIPNGVEIISYWALSSSSKLARAKISDSVVNIGNCAFFRCTSLQSIILGKNIKKILKDAFGKCDALETIYYKGTAEDWDAIKIDDKSKHLLNARRYYYSETKPETDGNFWHYGEDGEAVIW